MGDRRFVVELIKPSHYDDDGYVIQWWKSWIPSNSLACLYGIATDLAERRALGPDVAIEIHAYDECHTVIPIRRIIRRIKGADAGLVCLVGVQSNQFPRAMDLAARFRAAGIQVAVGGFHVSGCLAMLPELPPDLAAAQRLGVTLFAGEAEGRLAGLFADALAGRLQPIYNYMNDLPGLQQQVTPFLPLDIVRRYGETIGAFDAGRGCPFQCSFCTIINVQGRKSRWRDADDVERLVRANLAQGVFRFFITDDNFARNRNWEAIFDRLIEMREQEGLGLQFIIQVDTLCHRIPNFIEKAARAGCKRVFIGLENINPDNLLQAKKKQNRVHEYRQMFLAWRGTAGHHLCRLHPRLSGRHAGADRARHPHRAAGTAGRSARIFHSDAAAGLGRPPGARQGRGVDGPRHEQIRPRARHHRPPGDDRQATGRRSIARPGTSIIRPSTSRRSSAAPRPPGSSRCDY